MSFLTNRADSLAKTAENLRKLEGVCIKFGLVPKSGDLYTEASWPNPVDGKGQPLDYWPDKDNSVLLTKSGTFPEHVAAVRVHSDGLYGHVINSGGNHDMYISDLEHLLQRAGLTPAE